MPEFKIVTNDYRASRLGPLASALIDGKTVLVPERTGTAGLYQTLKRRGFRLRQHKHADGMVLWAEPLNGTENGTGSDD
jgi:hypothetical protein